jgi:2-polyprenyl-6-methoxyphenol hydroxylase-like FAD-dependent oxidoreductase
VNFCDAAPVVAGMSTPSTRHYDHAVVVGASMAGLAMAEALSRHFRRVTIIERDALPEQPQNRPGVPQGQHLHVLLTGGANALEELLPGFGDGLLEAGAVPVHLPTDMLWLNPRGWVRPFDPRYPMLSASRSLIEWQARTLVSRNAGITILDRRNVIELRLSDDRRRVTGVTISGGDEPTCVEQVDADLVVDAGGRRSRLPDWLDRLGFQRPAETRIDAHLSYATRIYRRPPIDAGWKAIYLQAQPPESSRMGILFPIEGDRWILTLQGAGDDRPPTSEDGFADFVASLRSPAIYEAISGAEPLTDAVGWANTANLRRHYDRAQLPDRLLAVGDSACAFNPVYGQGMTIGAQTAVALHEQLERHRRERPTLDGFTRQMQNAVAKVGEGAWMIAIGDDLRFPDTTGPKPSRLTRFQHRYLDRALAAATVDETVMDAVLQAFMLLAPPTVLFRPSIVARALRLGGEPNTEPPTTVTSEAMTAAVA